MQHFKEQNWFAVGLDIIVVIVGIFLGMQVQQWYEDREFAANERVLLGKLKNEIETNYRLTSYRIEFLTNVKDSGERAIAFLESDASCSSNCWQLLVDFFIASQASPTPSVTTINEEMRRLGLPRSATIKETIDDYYVFSEAVNTAIDLKPKYRELIRELMSAKAMKILWENCHSIERKGLEKLIVNCEQQLSDEDVSALLDKFKRNSYLLGYLSNWIGLHYVYIPMFKLLQEGGAETISVIEDVLKES
jgi:hypothetical protein